VTDRVRPAAVAGSFYPAEPGHLRSTVRRLLEAAERSASAADERVPKAIIGPHAGYRYSGPVAATAYASVAGARGIVRRVIIAGPAHFAPVGAVAVSAASAFATPLGRVTVDAELRRRVLDVPGVVVDDVAHRSEHSIEVHLPFVTTVLGDVPVLPLAVGSTGASALAAVLEALWGGAETLVVISTDLSHYHEASVARLLDGRTAAMICRLLAPPPEAACGAAAVAGMLLAARRRGLEVRALDVRNSADTVGDPARVVGYGAFAAFDPAAGDGAER